MTDEINSPPDLNSVLHSIYYNPNNSGSFSSAWSLYTATKRQQPFTNPAINYKQVKHWLQTQLTHTLHKPARKHFPRRRFRVHRVDEQWQLDLGFMVQFAHQNNGNQYLLYAIDILSRYVWVEPVKNKTASATAESFSQILNRAAPRKPEAVFSDSGGEFTGMAFRELLKRNN